MDSCLIFSATFFATAFAGGSGPLPKSLTKKTTT
jgi:hypothetical protein